MNLKEMFCPMIGTKLFLRRDNMTSQKKGLRTNQITEIGILLALATVTELAFMFLPRQPQGGSISLTMLPLFVITYRHGFKVGLIGGMIYGFLDLMLNGFTIYHWGSLFLDYLFAFGAVGLSALAFKIDKDSAIYFMVGILIGSFARFIMHFLSGAILFGEYAPEGTPVVLYSLTYNGSYMLGSMVLCMVIGGLIFRRLNEQLQSTEL